MSFTSRRDVFLIVGARGFGFLGDFLAATSLILALQARGAGGYAVAALLIAAALPTVVLAPVAARVVDRFDSRLILTTVGVAQALSCALMAFVGSPWLLIALAGLLSVGLAFSGPTLNALLPEAAGLDGVGRATAVMQTGTSVGALLGPALAGLLVGFSGVRVPLLLDAVCYLLIGGAGLLIGTRRGTRPEGRPTAASTWRFRSDTLILAVVTMIGLLVLAVNATQVVAVFYIRATLHGSATVYGLVEAAWTAGMLVGGWAGSWRPGGDRSLSRRLVVLHLATAAVCIVAGRLADVGWMFPLWFLGGICNGMINNALAVLVARRVPAASRGRCYAVLGAIASGANLIGFTLGGVLVEQVSPATIISGGGVLGFVLVALLGIHIWRVSAMEPAAATTSPAPGRPDASTGQSADPDPGDRAPGPVEAVASRS